jgi:hypothetical protein
VAQQLERAAAGAAEVEVDGGERGDVVGGERAVVEADDAEVARDGPARAVRGVEHPEGEVVVAAEDRGHRAVGDEGGCGLGRGAHGPSGVDDLGCFDPGVGEGVGPAVLAAGLRRDGEVVHGLVPHGEQVSGGASGDGAVVERDAPVGRVRLRSQVLAAGGDRRARLLAPQHLHGVRGGLVVGDDDGGGAVVREPAEDVGVRVRLVGVQDRDEDREPGGPGSVLDAAEGLGGPVQGGVGGEDGDRPQGAAGEGARRPVGPVAQLVDRGLDPDAGGLGDPGCIVDDARDGLVRDTRTLRDVEHAGGSGVGGAHGGRSPFDSGGAIRRWRS